VSNKNKTEVDVSETNDRMPVDESINADANRMEAEVVETMDESFLPVNEVEIQEGTPKKGFKGLLSRLKPGAKKQKQRQQLQNLETGYQEVVGLVRSVREHLDRQEMTQSQLISSMENLPAVFDSLKTVGESSEHQRKAIEQQGEAIERQIAHQTEVAGQQAEVLGVIRTQLVGNVEQSRNIVNSMDRFNDTLFSMDSTTRRIAEGARSTEDTLKDLVEKSEKRLYTVLCLMSVVLLTVVGLVAYLFSQGLLGDSTPPPDAPGISEAATPAGGADGAGAAAVLPVIGEEPAVEEDPEITEPTSEEAVPAEEAEIDPSATDTNPDPADESTEIPVNPLGGEAPAEENPAAEGEVPVEGEATEGEGVDEVPEELELIRPKSSIDLERFSIEIE
jgi:hypothetical protein